jgi:DNA-directed RNA polymerase sigma subunit (sigma70/sigma32)
LVVSTTNRATDAVALSIGNAVTAQSPALLSAGTLRRIGKGVSIQKFAAAGLESMLMGTESDTLRQIDNLASQLPTLDSWEEKALTRQRISELRSSGSDQSKHNFLDANVRVVISTAFKATTYLKDSVV